MWQWVRPLWWVLVLLVCMSGVFGSSQVWAADDLPSAADVKQRLDQLQSIQSPDADTRSTIETLNATLELLQQYNEAQADLQAFERQAQEAPNLRQRYERELRQLDEHDTLSTDALDQMSLDTLEERMAATLDLLKKQQDALAETNRQLINAQTLPERAQASIQDALTQILQIQSRLNGATNDDTGALSDAERDRLRAQQALLETRIEQNRRELANNTELRDLAQTRRELLTRQVEENESVLLVLQTVINQRRRDKSEQAIADAIKNDSNAQQNSPLIEQARAHNRALSQDLLTTTDRVNTLIRKGIEVRTQLDRVRQVERTLNEQIEALQGSLLLAKILRQQRQSLPDVDMQQGLKEEIGDLRLKQFDLAQAREALTNVERYVNEQIAKANIEITPELKTTLTQLYQSRRDLIDQLDREYGNLLGRAIDLQLNQQQLYSISDTVRSTIEEQLFWIANGQPLGWSWLKNLPQALAAEVADEEWRDALTSLVQRPSVQALWMLPILFMALGIAYYRRRIKAHLLKLHNEIGRLKRDTQLHTPRAILLNLVLASTGPLLLLGVGGVLRLGGENFAVSLGEVVLRLALVWGIFALMRRLLVPDGVAARHFHWPTAYVARLRRLLFWLGISLIPIITISTLADQSQNRLADQPIGLLILLAGLISMSVVMARLIFAHVPYFGVKMFRMVLGALLSGVPLVLAGLVVFGYEYTALKLCGRFITTLYILALWLLVEASVVRGLAVAARRLAYRRAVARRRAQVQEGAEGGLEVVEEPPLDMEQVNQQSLRLSKLILFLIFTLVLYLVWADLLTVLSYLDTINVWEVRRGEGENATMTNISLANVLTALISVGLMTVMARNLPGLLEVMVLSRMNLKQGSAYAISSLLSYVIVGSGVVVALGTLGVSWDRLQWLVAALSVGLGFGLQEIFANFISGLIILFERPIRIGDTITLNDLHGTVSRIRIRATTVTDFDRKEIIIPNKTFVTDRLINWSLSDNITRVVLKFGVAHGTDLDVAHRLLHQIADEHGRVLKDPEPQVFCMSYGINAFDFELRVYVNDLGDRLPVTDEINRRVDTLFREQGIRVAFQQMDVWLHNSNGDARKIDTKAADQLGMNGA
ncbi:mechanosensitive channel MscK [Phytohalomonas tamaricis]|uniref:mechanosensitive channel MscK n=1 Tax=Phytohalomonas tamaricis TaxID=2081032 RepID=UPI000D0B084A|nr:mechanosensitive channel MscK [Phytohalomonas tamaricis]